MTRLVHRSSVTLHTKPVRGDPQCKLMRAYDSFILSLKAGRRSERTIEHYDCKLRPFLEWLVAKGVTEYGAVEASHIRTYLLEREQDGVAPRTVFHHAATIRAFFNFLVLEDMIRASPMRKVKMPKVGNEIQPAFSVEDVKKLLGAAAKSVRDTAIVLFLLDSGCRISEFLKLNIGDVDVKTGSVIIRLGKGQKDRVVYIGTRTRKALAKYLLTRPDASITDPLWVTMKTNRQFDSERMTRVTMRGMLDRLGQRAGVQNCHPHTFRRTCALWSLRSGMDIYALQRLMGHEDLKTLRRYLSLTQDDVEKAHSEHGAVDNQL